MDPQTQLALLRTGLAQKRTALAELQFSVLLVTLPLTVHTGIVLMTREHVLVERLHLLTPFWTMLGLMLLGGVGLAVHAVRSLLRVNRRLARLEAEIEQQRLLGSCGRNQDGARGTNPRRPESLRED